VERQSVKVMANVLLWISQERGTIFLLKTTDRRHDCYTVKYNSVTDHSQQTASLALEAEDKAALQLLKVI